MRVNYCFALKLGLLGRS